MMAREAAAWVGLMPGQHSSGGKERLLGISKRGDAHLRTYFLGHAPDFLTTSHSWTVRELGPMAA